MIKSILREPLLHFLVLSACIFVLSPSNDAALQDDEAVVVVSETDIAHFMQNLDPSLTRAAAITRLRSLPAEQRQNLVGQYVENEVLYREALRLGLEKSDAVIRQRLIQRVRFMLQGMADATSIEEPKLAEYFEQHRSRYRIPEKVSFKHRFFKSDQGQEGHALQRAERALEIDDPSDADSFPYFHAYLDQSEAQITRHFGDEFASAVMELEANPDSWQGPIRSTFGYHLVNLTSKHEAISPELNDVRARVTEDFRRAEIQARERAAVSALLTRYQVIETDWSAQIKD